jgi:cytochrome c oxidase cbb3-type subunit 3
VPRGGSSLGVYARADAWHLRRVNRSVVVLALALAACDSGVVDTADGEQVFANVCAACHGPTGKPNEAMVARLAVKDLTAPDERAKITPAFVENQVRNGSKNKLMPGFAGALRDDQIKAVAAFVASPHFVH